MILPFDAHNHIHMGPTAPVQALLSPEHAASTTVPEQESPLSTAVPIASSLSGMAIMSTHPRDFDRVMHLNQTLPEKVEGNLRVVPCFGIHPWWLHELTEEDWQIVDNSPRWVHELEARVSSHPDAIVGEIGLDGFHFDPITKELTSPMEKQMEAFRLQMELAARLERPVSIHTVQCFGSLFETITKIKKDAKKNKVNKALPPKMYFHAFGGKTGTIDQLLALCGREPGVVYFGFAPVINFRSPKTVDVIRKIGIERLVLETDHEDAAYVPESVVQCIKYLASALEKDEEEIVERTTANAFALYGLN